MASPTLAVQRESARPLPTTLLQKKVMSLRFWLTHPRMLAARLQYFVWERMNPDKPWLCPGTVRFCEKHLDRSMKGLEFGSGRSTVWFAGQVGSLTSVEHNSEWFEKVQHLLVERGVTKVDYRFVPPNHAVHEASHAPDQPTPDYVRVAEDFPDRSLDLVVVDGLYRNHCIRRAVRKLRPGGYLLVDDVNVWPSVELIPVPASWPAVNDSTNGLKRCIIWKAV
jgi:hypothetical protein